MNDDERNKEAARQRLFDAVLSDAVNAETAVRRIHDRRRSIIAVALVALAAAATIGVALLRSNPDQTQDPRPFDPLFPRIERELHLDHRSIQVRSLDAAKTLPSGSLPPVAVIDEDSRSGSRLDVQTFCDMLASVTAHRGVRSMTIHGDSSLPVETWQRVAEMHDLQTLGIACPIGADDLRRLRHAPKLRMVRFEKTRSEISRDVISALLELPHLDAVGFLWQSLPASTLRRLSGLPGLRMLYLEKCTFAPSWIEELRALRTLSWLSINFGPWKPATLDEQQARAFSNIEKLEALHLSNVVMEADAIRQLPASLRMLGLHDPVPPSVLRDLLERPHLRGLRLGTLAPGTIKVLCEDLPSSGIERLGLHRAPSATLWDVLERLPNLRHLSVGAGRDAGGAIERIAGLTQIEHLELHVGGLPTPTELGPLRQLPRLRRVVVSESSGRPGIGNVDPEDLRRCLGEAVDVLVR